MTIRNARFAGQFFPKEPDALLSQIKHLMDQAARVVPPLPAPIGIVSPHAGYRYSGALAARAFQSAKQGHYSRIIILSPSHRHRFKGLALPKQDKFATPAGISQIDINARDALIKENLASMLDAAHDDEHGIEAQLPFVQHLWPDAKIVPLVAGAGAVKLLDKVLKLLAGDEKENTLVVISTDLSHFLDDAAAQKIDELTSSCIEGARQIRLKPQHACGWQPLTSFLEFSRDFGLSPQRLGRMNSSAVGGDKSRVVGYGAWSFTSPGDACLSDELRGIALDLARRAIEYRLSNGKEPKIEPETFHPLLQTFGASFVTLTQEDRLRGCIGTTAPRRPLICDIGAFSVAAGFADRRFSPLTKAEFEKTKVKISVLTRPAAMDFSNEEDLCAQLKPGRDGLILSAGSKRGVFLPSVWESLNEPDKFISALKVKAGLKKDFWSRKIKIDRFMAESFGE